MNSSGLGRLVPQVSRLATRRTALARSSLTCRSRQWTSSNRSSFSTRPACESDGESPGHKTDAGCSRREEIHGRPRMD